MCVCVSVREMTETERESMCGHMHGNKYILCIDRVVEINKGRYGGGRYNKIYIICAYESVLIRSIILDG